MNNKVEKILFILGIAIILFFFFFRGIASFNHSSVVYNYKEEISQTSKEDLDDRRKNANEYNENLSAIDPIISIGDELDSNNVSKNSFDFLKSGNVIGNIEIPKIKMNLPIYDGIGNDNLEKGAVHLKDTSYPTGKESTHTVIVGHTGLTTSKIFDDIDKLELGDYFKVEYLGEEIGYKVISIKIVEPDNTEDLKIVENKTLVTLVTCIPKSVNSHRLLVTGEKIEQSSDYYDNDEVKESGVELIVIEDISIIQILILFGILVSSLIIIVFVVLRFINRRKRNTTKRRGSI